MAAIVRTLLLVTFVALSGAAGSASAQAMYRCGKSFQDRPCDSGQSGQAIGRSAAPAGAASTGSGSNAPAGPGSSAGDVQCAQRGIAAQKITWEREAGMTEQAQLSSPKSSAQRQLIADVYQRRGSAPQIRAAVEADCLRENERQAQAAAVMAAAAKALGQNPLPAASRVADEASSSSIAEPKNVAKEDSRKDQCAALQRSADDVRARQRAGGTVATMEKLNRERQAIDKRLSDAAC